MEENRKRGIIETVVNDIVNPGKVRRTEISPIRADEPPAMLPVSEKTTGGSRYTLRNKARKVNIYL